MVERRLERDWQLLSQLPNLTVEAVEDRERVWIVKQRGATGTPYAEGAYEWEVSFPPDYPFKPPWGKLKTEIYHVNLSMATRRTMMTAWLPKDQGGGLSWAPQFTVADIFEAIDRLMTEPYIHGSHSRSLEGETLKAACPSVTTGMQLSVKTLTGKLLTVECGPSDTILALRGAIQDAEGIPINEGELIYAGHRLENDQTLEDYGITTDKEVVLHLVLRLGRPPALEDMVQEELLVVYTDDRPAFDERAVQWARASISKKVITLVTSELEGEQTFACIGLDGEGVHASSILLSDISVKHVRTTVAQKLNLPTSGVALVTESGLLLPMTHDSSSIADAILWSELPSE